MRAFQMDHISSSPHLIFSASMCDLTGKMEKRRFRDLLSKARQDLEEIGTIPNELQIQFREVFSLPNFFSMIFFLWLWGVGNIKLQSPGPQRQLLAD